ncbi:hypothetical protein CWE15_10230 [Aliidiomarina taiwanensis]|uniref:Tyr recombinase domain-containing protein n=1 Tax=Aliidiomarina taiwanensis TaxID=946228 RepID=A0A432WYK4_9GAMM|nr:DUF6538 domain-containing protein [Aliidiomarina taiwanensis]RUO38874.1 hypothetical protein CWE15_10230 [Aliidiomarina taiwanensis]
MSKKKSIIDRNLNKRGNVYWYSRRIPKELHDVLGKKREDISLKTSDLQLARILRDEKDAEISRLLYHKTALRRAKLEQALGDFRLYQMKSVDSGSVFIDFPLSSADLRAMGHEVEADALSILEGSKETKEKYSLSLGEAVSLTKQRKQGSITDESLHRYDKAAEKFAEFMREDVHSLPLKSIDRVTAHKFVRFLETSSYKRATIQGLLNRLKVVWQQSANLGHVGHENPFDNQDIIVADTREDNKTQLFSDAELEQIIDLVNQQSRDFKLIIKILAFTGARPAEICNLSVDAFREHEGVKVLVIKQGKTLAASRFIPLTEELINDIESHCNLRVADAPLFDLDAKEVGRIFSRLKSKVISSDERKVMYSLRVHFATAAQRAGVREDIAAQIVGHSNAKTLTFGYYSKGHEAPVLKQNYDKIALYIRERWKMHIRI